MSFCELTARIPLFEQCTPDEKKPRSLHFQTILCPPDGHEYHADMFGYFENPPPPEHTVCGVVASFGHAGTEPALLSLEIQSLEVYDGTPDDPNYIDNLPPLLPIRMDLCGKVASINSVNREFTVSGTTYIQHTYKEFVILCCFLDTSRWSKTNLPTVNSPVAIRGSLNGKENHKFAIQIDRFTQLDRFGGSNLSSNASSPRKPQSGGYWDSRKRKNRNDTPSSSSKMPKYNQDSTSPHDNQPTTSGSGSGSTMKDNEDTCSQTAEELEE